MRDECSPPGAAPSRSCTAHHGSQARAAQRTGEQLVDGDAQRPDVHLLVAGGDVRRLHRAAGHHLHWRQRDDLRVRGRGFATRPAQTYKMPRQSICSPACRPACNCCSPSRASACGSKAVENPSKAAEAHSCARCRRVRGAARLGRHVLDGAHGRDGHLLQLAHGQPEVAHAYRAVRRQEDVLQLHIPAGPSPRLRGWAGPLL